MKLGLSTWSLLGLDVYSAVEAIGDAGLEYVELWGEVPHAFPDWIDKKRLKDALSSYSMVVTTHAPFTDLNISSPFQPVKAAVEKTLEEFVEFNVYLGATMTTMHPGSVHNEGLVAQSRGSAAGVLKKMMEAARGRLSISVENLAMSASKYHFPLASTTESLLQVLADTEGTRCTVDTGHAHVSGFNSVEMVEQVGDKLAEIHLSDNAGLSDDHLIPGKGTISFEGLMNRASRTDALLCLELNPHKYSEKEVLGSIEGTRSLLHLR
jgi:sugar phosphate isomerase/epimerase